MNQADTNPRTVRPTRPGGLLVALLVGLATIVFIGIPLIFFSGTASQDGLLLPASSNGNVTGADGGDVRASVTEGVSGVLNAQGYIAERVISVDNEPAMSTWVRSSATGEFEAVQFSNPTRVLKMLSQGGAPPLLSALDDQPPETAALTSDGALTVKAENGGSWDSIDISSSFDPVGVDLVGMAAGDDDFFYLNEVNVSYTRQPTTDGGELWTMKTSGKSPLFQQWEVSGDGYLRYYRVDFPGAAEFTLELVLEALDARPEITTPDVGSALDLARFDLPSDLIRP